MTATQRVLDTCELLESIIHHLPNKDIFSVKIVSRQWNSLIANSVQSQRALLLLGRANHHLGLELAAIQSIDDLGFGDYPPPPLQTKAFSINPAFRKTEIDDIIDFDLLNPLTYSVYEPVAGRFCNYRRCCYRLAWDTGQGAAEWLTNAGVMRAMFLTQPPCTAVAVWSTGSEGGPYQHVIAVIREEDGVTLGLIMDTFHRMVIRCNDGESRRVRIAFDMEIGAEKLRAETS